MADLNELQASDSVKLAGATSTGVETNYVAVDANQNMQVTNTPLDGVKSTYSASIATLVPAATATDIFIINGSATKTVRILCLSFEMTTTSGSGASVNISLIKRSTANTGGTSTTLSNVAHDSNSAASTCTVLAYTANPTAVGTAVGAVRSFRYSVPAANTIDPVSLFFGDRPGQAIVLRGVAQSLAINFNAGSFTGAIISIDVEWSEE